LGHDRCVYGDWALSAAALIEGWCLRGRFIAPMGLARVMLWAGAACCAVIFRIGVGVFGAMKGTLLLALVHRRCHGIIITGGIRPDLARHDHLRP
jgi:hypothetical protein